jgi:ABC-type Fe3+-siderophore transport system permease subunit
MTLLFNFNYMSNRDKDINTMDERNKTRIGGLFIFTIAAGLTVNPWYDLIYNRYYYPKAVLIGPCFVVIGLALILFPSYREERIARGEDISSLQGIDLITTRWWVILFIAIGAGFLNLYLVSKVLPS